MSLSVLFNQTWRAYRFNAAVSAKIMLIYYFIPFVLLMSLILFFAHLSGLLPAFNELSSSLVNASNIDKPGAPADAFLIAQVQDAAQHFLISAMPVLLIGILFGLVFLFVSFFGYSALIAGASRSSVMHYSNALKAARESYWSLMGCFALLMLIFFILESVLILFVFLSAVVGSLFGSIGGILFFFGSFLIGVFGCFAFLGRLILAPYVLMIESLGVMTSFKKSWMITRGRTWAMVGLLLLLIAMLIILILILMFLFYIISLFLLIPYNSLNAETISWSLFVFEAVLQIVIHLVLALFIIPFIVHFFKQIYVSWNRSRDIKGKRIFK